MSYRITFGEQSLAVLLLSNRDARYVPFITGYILYSAREILRLAFILLLQFASQSVF